MFNQLFYKFDHSGVFVGPCEIIWMNHLNATAIMRSICANGKIFPSVVQVNVDPKLIGYISFVDRLKIERGLKLL